MPRLRVDSWWWIAATRNPARLHKRVADACLNVLGSLYRISEDMVVYESPEGHLYFPPYASNVFRYVLRDFRGAPCEPPIGPLSSLVSVVDGSKGAPPIDDDPTVTSDE